MGELKSVVLLGSLYSVFWSKSGKRFFEKVAPVDSPPHRPTVTLWLGSLFVSFSSGSNLDKCPHRIKPILVLSAQMNSAVITLAQP